MSNEKKIAIIGGGLSGLSLAFYLSELNPNNCITVYEKNKWGGLIQTIQTKNQKVVELAANAFLGHPEFFQIANKIGATPVQSASKLGRYIFRIKATRWPLRGLENLKLLSLMFKFIFLKQSFIPNARESIYDWGHRTLGKAITNFLLEPVLRGVYSGDFRQLSATLFYQKLKSNEKTKGLFSFQNGMGEFISKLKKYLDHKVNFAKEEISDLPSVLEKFDTVIVATSPASAALLLNKNHPKESQMLGVFEMRSIASITLFLNSTKPIKGYGCLFPEAENMNSLGVLWSRDIFPVHGEQGIERWMLLYTEQDTDDSLLNKIKEDRKKLYGENHFENKQSFPSEYHIQKWPQGLPHMTTQIEDYVTHLNNPIIISNSNSNSNSKSKSQKKKIYLHGNYLGRMGTTDILLRSQKLAKTINQEL